MRSIEMTETFSKVDNRFYAKNEVLQNDRKKKLFFV